VSTAEPERMFSKVDSTLTEIRSTMSEDRLEAVVNLCRLTESESLS